MSKLREMVEKATKGPWSVSGQGVCAPMLNDEGVIGSFSIVDRDMSFDDESARLIVALRNLAPALVAWEEAETAWAKLPVIFGHWQKPDDTTHGTAAERLRDAKAALLAAIREATQ